MSNIEHDNKALSDGELQGVNGGLSAGQVVKGLSELHDFPKGHEVRNVVGSVLVKQVQTVAAKVSGWIS